MGSWQMQATAPCMSLKRQVTNSVRKQLSKALGWPLHDLTNGFAIRAPQQQASLPPASLISVKPELV